jgi:hypothetical protein
MRRLICLNSSHCGIQKNQDLYFFYPKPVFKHLSNYDKLIYDLKNQKLVLKIKINPKPKIK